jgi:glycogen operon protein
MDDQDWDNGYARSVAIFLNGHGIPDRDQLGERVVDDSFLLLVNGHYEGVTFSVPDERYGRIWEVVVDTADPLLADAETKRRNAVPNGKLEVPGRSILVLRTRTG